MANSVNTEIQRQLLQRDMRWKKIQQKRAQLRLEYRFKLQQLRLQERTIEAEKEELIKEYEFRQQQGKTKQQFNEEVKLLEEMVINNPTTTLEN